MNEFHQHLIINHFPIVGTILAALVLFVGLLMRNDLVKRVAFGLFILSAILSLPANKTGEDAEHAIENSAGIDKSLVENHEDMAGFGFWSAIITGLLSVLAFYLSYKENDLRGVLAFVVLIASFAAIYFMWQTGLSGGKIRHTEIQVSEKSAE
jgi:uncharacterized membrane protein